MEENAKRYTRFYTDDLPEWLAWLDYSRFQTILDLGAGDGAILYALSKRGWLSNKKVFALEASAVRLSKVVALNLGVYCLKGDATDFPIIKDTTMDLIICNQVIEHTSDDEKLIKEAYRVLKYGGAFYLSTVFKNSYFNLGYHRCNGKRTLDPTHLREYTEDSQLWDKLSKYFKNCYQRKTLQWFAITDFLLKRLGIQGHIYERSWFWRALRKIRLPIIGYYNWEILLWKE